MGTKRKEKKDAGINAAASRKKEEKSAAQVTKGKKREKNTGKKKKKKKHSASYFQGGGKGGKRGKDIPSLGERREGIGGREKVPERRKRRTSLYSRSQSQAPQEKKEREGRGNRLSATGKEKGREAK